MSRPDPFADKEKLTIYLPPHLAKKLRMLAITDDTFVSGLIESAVCHSFGSGIKVVRCNNGPQR